MSEISAAEDLAVSARLVNSLREIVTFLVGLGAFFTVAGFIVVNTHLSQYTPIRTFDVDTGQYLAAGFSLSFFYTIAFVVAYLTERQIDLIDSKLRSFLVRFSVTVGVALVTSVILGSLFVFFSSLSFFDSVLSLFTQVTVALFFSFTILSEFLSRPNFSQLWSVANIGFAILTLIYAVVGGVIFGINYNTIPHTLGGGQPIPVRLIFDEADVMVEFGLTADPTVPTQSEPVCLLAELNTGLLIFDPDSQDTYTLNDGLIIGMRGSFADCRHPLLRFERLSNPIGFVGR